MTAALDRCTAALGNPNVRAFLRVIREGESSQDDSAYTVINGGTHFAAPPWAHPYHGIPTTQGGKAAGAYQFLGTTWARCDEALGLAGDFSPPSQDAAAVYLIAGRGALPAVEAGRLVAACAALAPEWVSLPGLGLERVRHVFTQYGGTAQEGAGATISGPDVPIPQPTEKKPMFPLLLPALLQVIPQLAGIFGAKGEKVAQMSQVAEAVTSAITTATGTTNLQAGLEAMTADPAAKASAVGAVLASPPVAALLEAGEAGGGGIAGARKAAADPTAPPFWQTAPFWIALLLLGVVYGVLWSMLYYAPTVGLWRPEDRSQVLMLAVAISSGVMGYFLGSSIGSSRKDSLLGPK